MRWYNNENGVGIAVTMLPRHKSPSLMIIRDNMEEPVGTVTDKDKFEAALNEMLEPFMTDPNR